jgi:hypothetical protein
LRGEHVVAGVDLEAGAEAADHAGLRSEVEHRVHPVQEALESLGRQVELHEREPRLVADALEIALLGLARVVRREAVDAQDRVAVFDQPFAQVRAEEARAARHEHALLAARRRAGWPLRSVQDRHADDRRQRVLCRCSPVR